MENRLYRGFCGGNHWLYCRERQDGQRAKEKVQSAIPSIEKMIEAGMIDEYTIYEAHKAGRDKKGKTSKNICWFDDVTIGSLGEILEK